MNASAEISLLLAYLGLNAASGGVLIPLLAQLAKKLFGLKAAPVIHTMVMALEAVQAALLYYAQVHGVLPLPAGILAFLTTHGASQFIYKNTGYVKSATNILSRVQFSLAPAAPVATAPVAPAVAVAAPEVAPVAPEQPAPAAAGDFNL